MIIGWVKLPKKTYLNQTELFWEISVNFLSVPSACLIHTSKNGLIVQQKKQDLFAWWCRIQSHIWNNPHKHLLKPPQMFSICTRGYSESGNDRKPYAVRDIKRCSENILIAPWTPASLDGIKGLEHTVQGLPGAELGEQGGFLGRFLETLRWDQSSNCRVVWKQSQGYQSKKFFIQKFI